MTSTVQQPAHSSFADGEAVDLGTHANDFLVPRENASSTEVFTTRVPGQGEVPLHVHPDMEQTFVFVAGLGEVTVQRGEQQHRFRCHPGDVVFVPSGWWHGVAAASPEGCTYVTVCAFLADQERIGDDALTHAGIAAAGFGTRDVDATTVEATRDGAALLRAAETCYRPDQAGARMWADPAPLTVVADREPGTYRVRKVGPFEFAAQVNPVARVVDADVADLLHAVVAGRLPVYVEGSQSPLSIKPPHSGSDVDVLLAVETPEQLAMAREVIADLMQVQDQVGAPLSPGVVHAPWLELALFYSAVSLDPEHADRRWFSAGLNEIRAELEHRQVTALGKASAPQEVRALLEESMRLLGDQATVLEWHVTPRWKGLL